MTEAETMIDEVRRVISGTVVMFPHPLAARDDTFLVGDRNADVIIRALDSAGWSWVLRSRPEMSKGKDCEGRGYPNTPEVR